MATSPRIDVLPEAIRIHDLTVGDERVRDLIRQANADAPATILAMLAIGAQGLGAMVDARSIDYVREQVNGLLLKTESAISRLGDRLAAESDEKFDPGRPGSYSQRIAAEVDRARGEINQCLRDTLQQIKNDEAQLRRELDASLNPSVPGSTANVAVATIHKLLEQVNEDFDPTNKNGHVAKLCSTLEQYGSSGGPLEATLRKELKTVQDGVLDELRALRDLVVHQQATRAAKPAAIGEGFETAVETVLEHAARSSDGDWVENMTKKVGEATDAKAGDFDYHLGGGLTIAVEARRRRDRITLGGRGGVLEQLTKTKANRRADFAIYCVADEAVLPDQVGYLQRYGADRIVCCFGAQGEILALALKFARLLVMAEADHSDAIDSDQIRTALEEMQRKLSSLGAVKRWCTNISESADKIRAHVGTVVIEITELVEQALAAISTAKDPASDGRNRAA
jgi:hypothetical protein